MPGHTEDEGFKWCIDSIEALLPKAEEYGVLLALENHWGLARTPEGQLRILDAIKSPWLGALMDTGNFLEDPYPKLEMIAPRTVFVQAKTYHGGGEWYTLDLDYQRIAGSCRRSTTGARSRWSSKEKRTPTRPCPGASTCCARRSRRSDVRQAGRRGYTVVTLRIQSLRPGAPGGRRQGGSVFKFRLIPREEGSSQTSSRWLMR